MLFRATTNTKGRPTAALFGTHTPVPRPTLASWARRLAQEEAWAHPALLAGDAHRLLHALAVPGAPLLATERSQWQDTARRIDQTSQEVVEANLRAAFRTPQDLPSAGGPDSDRSHTVPLRR